MRISDWSSDVCSSDLLPLLELIEDDAELWAIELSSYQTREVAASGVRPEIAVVTNVFPEHLDCHGGELRLIEANMALLTDSRPRIGVLNADVTCLAALPLPIPDTWWFDGAHGRSLRGD